MIRRYYAELGPDGEVIQTTIVDDPEEGPPQQPETDRTYVLVDGPLDWDPPTPTSVKKIVEGIEQWVETNTLPGLKAAAISQTYLDVDAVYEAAIGRRTTEYKEAEEDARAFAAAGFVGEVSEYVSAYATYNPTGLLQTNQWAAEQILVRADAFAVAQRLMRSTRFARQAQMQAATTAEELSAAVGRWNGFIAALRNQLGL